MRFHLCVLGRVNPAFFCSQILSNLDRLIEDRTKCICSGSAVECTVPKLYDPARRMLMFVTAEWQLEGLHVNKTLDDWISSVPTYLSANLWNAGDVCVKAV